LVCLIKYNKQTILINITRLSSWPVPLTGSNDVPFLRWASLAINTIAVCTTGHQCFHFVQRIYMFSDVTWAAQPSCRRSMIYLWVI